jgi:hypothetical protein
VCLKCCLGVVFIGPYDRVFAPCNCSYDVLIVVGAGVFLLFTLLGLTTFVEEVNPALFPTLYGCKEMDLDRGLLTAQGAPMGHWHQHPVDWALGEVGLRRIGPTNSRLLHLHIHIVAFYLCQYQ